MTILEQAYQAGVKQAMCDRGLTKRAGALTGLAKNPRLGAQIGGISGLALGGLAGHGLGAAKGYRMAVG